MKDDEDKFFESSLLNMKQYTQNLDNINYVINLGIIPKDKYNNSIYINCTPKDTTKNQIE